MDNNTTPVRGLIKLYLDVGHAEGGSLDRRAASKKSDLKLTIAIGEPAGFFFGIIGKQLIDA